MNLTLQIAKRYLFSKKISLINVISLISLIGVAGMAASIVVILSVFNGFDMVISSMINKFDPDIKISPATGKTFLVDSLVKQQIANLEQVEYIVESVEETALFQYEQKQYIAKIKGVDKNFERASQLPENVVIGQYLLNDSLNRNYAVVGSDIAVNLFININNYTSLKIYAPLRTENVTLNPSDAFNNAHVIPSGIFQVHQDYDSKYVIVPLDFARNVLQYKDNEVSTLEIAVKDYNSVDKTVKAIQQIVGNNFKVQNRHQQQEMLYKIMKSEKLSIFVILSFILVIASFNIIGALTMLIIDKKRDIEILKHLGADNGFVRKIFVNTGRLITFCGAVAGIIIGSILSLLQKKYGIIEFPSSGSFIIDAYPVDIQVIDILAAFFVVIIIGFTASIYPGKKLITD